MRRVIWLPALLLILVCGAYTAYWLHVRSEAARLIDAWAARQARFGAPAAWRDRTIGGFPFRVTARFEEPSLTLPGPGDPRARRLAAEGLDLHTLPYDLNHIIAQPRGVATLPDFQGGRVAITAEDLRASYRLTGAGVSRGAADSGALEARWPLAPGDDPSAAPVALRLEAMELYVAQSDDDPTQLRLFGRVEEPSWPGPDAEAAPDEAQLDVEINAADAFISRQDPRIAAADWARDGGALTVNTLAARWGEAALAARGALTLDAQGAWTGDLTVAIADPKAVLAHLATLGVIDRDAADAAATVAGLAAGRRGRLELPATVRDGVLTLFGVPLLALPPAA